MAKNPFSRASCEESNSGTSGVRSQAPEGSGCSAMESKGIMKADGQAAKPGQPSKPVAVVKPMRYVTPAFTDDVGQRDQGPREGRSQQAERGHLRGSDLPRERRVPRPSLRVESDHRAEPRHRVEGEARQAPSFASTGAATGHGQDAGLHAVQPGVGIQVVPDASGYWVLTNSPTSAVYPCLGFRPPEGSSLLFTQTPSGTFVYGVPEFFTHIAH
ncbi:LOW QUALITY PROTEIN: proline-rich protein 20G [Crocuta crocuta]